MEITIPNPSCVDAARCTRAISGWNESQKTRQVRHHPIYSGDPWLITSKRAPAIARPARFRGHLRIGWLRRHGRVGRSIAGFSLTCPSPRFRRE